MLVGFFEVYIYAFLCPQECVFCFSNKEGQASPKIKEDLHLGLPHPLCLATTWLPTETTSESI